MDSSCNPLQKSKKLYEKVLTKPEKYGNIIIEREKRGVQETMEQRIIDTLQQCVDGWKEAIDNEWNAFARFYQEKWNQVAPFAEEVLGKNVSIKNWKVVVISK